MCALFPEIEITKQASVRLKREDFLLWLFQYSPEITIFMFHVSFDEHLPDNKQSLLIIKQIGYFYGGKRFVYIGCLNIESFTFRFGIIGDARKQIGKG